MLAHRFFSTVRPLVWWRSDGLLPATMATSSSVATSSSSPSSSSSQIPPTPRGDALCSVGGFVAPGYESVRDVFMQNFEADGQENSAQICAYVRGEKVVDLWASRVHEWCVVVGPSGMATVHNAFGSVSLCRCIGFHHCHCRCRRHQRSLCVVVGVRSLNMLAFVFLLVVWVDGRQNLQVRA